jgi:small GTP-binding protein
MIDKAIKTSSSIFPMSAPTPLKIVLLGSSSVGKTSVLSRFIEAEFFPDHVSTVGAAYMMKLVTANSRQFKLQIWDTAGQEKFRSLAPIYYQHAQVALIVFDITALETFNDAERWYIEVKERTEQLPRLYLIDNKVDLEAEFAQIKHRLCRRRYSAPIGGPGTFTTASFRRGTRWT